MKASRFAGLATVAILTGASVAAYHFYETDHISSDLRRTLAASVDPHCSMNDELAYLREARLEVRTTRDARLEAYLQSAVENMQAAQDAQQRDLDLIRDGRTLDSAFLQDSQEHDADIGRWLHSFDLLRAELGLPAVKRRPEEPQ